MAFKEITSLFFSPTNDPAPYGKTWEEWTANWWQWVTSIPTSENPLTGHDLSINQYDKNVFFLAASCISGSIVEHNLSLSSTKSLLFPTININVSFAESPEIKDLSLEARRNMDNPIHNSAMIDGITVNAHRVHTTIPFDLNYPQDNIFNAIPGLTESVADGYWVFTKPLPAGIHDIHSIGSCSLGKNRFDARYHIKVK